MDLRKIKKLIELLEASHLDELEIREGEESIRLSRTSPNAYAARSTPGAALVKVGASDVDVATPVAESELVGGHVVTSPMVGTYFPSPKPGAEPFVKVGSKVEIGDTLCVIEAMKIFNQIEADRAGTVVKVFKHNGEPVEYGEALFVIE